MENDGMEMKMGESKLLKVDEGCAVSCGALWKDQHPESLQPSQIVIHNHQNSSTLASLVQSPSS